MDGRWSIMVDHQVEPPPIKLYSNGQWSPMAMVMMIELKRLNGKKGGWGVIDDRQVVVSFAAPAVQ